MWHNIQINDIEKKLGTSISLGLSEKESKNRRLKLGLNKLNDSKKENILIRFIKQFKDFMIIILLISAVISFISSYVQNTGDYIESVIIVAIVVFNAIMGLIQESKAEKSIEALKKMFSPSAKVKRNGKYITIPSENLVVGDIVSIEAGNLVPADIRLVSSFNLKVDESSLTGETIPVEKNTAVIRNKKIADSDILNMVFSSTVVTNGHGEGIVVETGMNTKVGKIASLLTNSSKEDTPLQKRLGNIGKVLGIITIIICVVIFLIGLLRNEDPLKMFMTSVGLAVASIPEGLPAIVTILLSIGITKMAKKNAIIRKLPAVETLGSSSVICSDKTGTLTQNKMTVTKTFGNTEILTKYMCMCTDSIINNSGIIGDPSENALLEFALKNNISKDLLYTKYPRINEIPFDSSRKLMTTIHKYGSEYLIITKGAPDVLIKLSNKYLDGNIEINITSTIKETIVKENEKMAENALRVLACGYKIVSSLPNKIDNPTIEKDLIFVGLCGMIDPPRENVKESIKEAKKAGIKTVMITGDHILTAKAIAKELGILNNKDIAITGVELDKISDKELEKNIMNYSVFARVSPEHKMRIVNAFKRQGKIVAMTGDGVNDAPALKSADIGVAMGKSGTDVAKNASDMILTDDNFVTIISAVKEGRHIYDNIKKAIHFLISTNIGEIVTMFASLLLKLPSPLLAIHLLWINLVTDSFPAIALGLEKPEDDIMRRPPINPKKSIFADGLWSKILVEGFMLGLLNLTIFCIFYSNYNLESARTAAFVSLGLIELTHSFNIKSKDSLFKTGVFSNKYLIGAFILGLILQVSVVLFEPVAKIFNVTRLNSNQWLLIFIFSFAPIIIMEIQKLITKNVRKKYIDFSSF